MSAEWEIQLERELRHERRQNRLGPDARCTTCGTTELVHLRKLGERLICGCCLAILRSRRLVERHHVAGLSEGPTVPVCASCHAALSDLQIDWLDPSTSFQERFERGWKDLSQYRKELSNEQANR